MTGAQILHCPDMCNGFDPGFGALKAGFTPQTMGLFDLKFQFCDPAVNAGEKRPLACFAKTPDAYDLTKMRPPQPPNVCNDVLAGQLGGARPGYACEVGDHIRFRIESTPDRVVALRSEVLVPTNMKVGQTYTINVNVKDRLLRNAALSTTRCTYTFTFFQTLTGSCSLNATDRTFTVPFSPNVSGVYNISVVVDDQVISAWDLSAVVTSQITSVDHDRTTAIGLGLTTAAVGTNNTFEIQLRDKWGGLIQVGLSTPLQGSPFFEDCGYPYTDIPSGEKTSGYGLVGDNIFGILATPWGCRYAFHTYLVDGDGRIIRPAVGFRVNKIKNNVDGSVSVRYEIDEPGDFMMYARYLPYNDAGQVLFNASGRLSLESMSTSREGQIHGSPFRIHVHPSVSDSATTYATGPGLEYGVLGKLDYSRFDVVARDRFWSLTPCQADEVSVTMLDPSGNALEDILVESGDDRTTECHVYYKAEVTGVHQVSLRVFDLEIPGSPFYPSVYLSAGIPSDAKSYARLITTQTPLPCFQAGACGAWARPGGNITVAVSARDALGALVDDSLSTFTASVRGPDGWLSEMATNRQQRGEHYLSLFPTRSGKYTLSMLMGRVKLPVMPSGGDAATFTIFPGDMHAPSSFVSGSGLTTATAGAVSRFVIVAKDRYGNGIAPHPSPNPTEFLPGRGRIQVVVRGEDNTTVYGSVVDARNGSFTVSYSLVSAAR